MSSRHLLIGAVAFFGVGIALWYLDSSFKSASGGTTAEFVLATEDGKLVSGPSELKVTEGDSVTITITSDEEEEFHLHGYDRAIDLVPGEPASLTFVANMSGAYPFELEHRKAELGTLIVAPN